MFSACASAGGRAISEGLAPCPMRDGKAYNLDTLAYDAARIEAKLHAFDSWLWNDCEGGDGQIEPTLQIDCIEAARSPLATLDEMDPPLFRGGTRLSIESNVNYLAANRAKLANTSTAAINIPPLMLENATISSHNRHEDIEAKPKPKPLIREVPEDLDRSQSGQEEAMNNRANEMKEKMQRRSQQMQSEWAKGTKKVQAWLVNNAFFGVNSKKSGLLSFTYPLHVAAAKNDAEMIQLLLLRDADPNQLDSKGRTPLQVAAKKCKKGSHRTAVAQLTAVS